MKQKKKAKGQSRRSSCPVACTLDVLGDRWTLLVVRDLFKGKKRFGEFLESAEKIPTNTLTDRLRLLEEEGMIEKVWYSERPLRAEYQLTAGGKELGHIIKAMYEWGSRQSFSKTRKLKEKR